MKKLACKRLAEGSKKSAEDAAPGMLDGDCGMAFVNIRAIREFWPIVNQGFVAATHMWFMQSGLRVGMM